jgi:hypothetical protein
MNVKLPETIDTETSLLRGVQSDTILQSPGPEPDMTTNQRTFVVPTDVVAPMQTRVSKSCYFESPMNRLDQGVLPKSFVHTQHIVPEWNSPALIGGESSRFNSKYT